MAQETSPQGNAPSPKKKKLSPMVIAGLSLLAVTGLLFTGLGLLGGLAPYALGILRDIAIVSLAILVALAMLITLFLLSALTVAINRLGERLDDVLQRGGAVLDQVKGTATTVKGTADFVGERVASPWIRVSSWASGLSEGLLTFFRGKKEKGGSR